MKKTASKITVWCWLAAASFLGGCILMGVIMKAHRHE